MRATWAPRGKTPVLIHPFNWKRLSVAAVVGYGPWGRDAWVVFGTRAGAYDEDSLVELLGELHRHLDGDKVTLIWDGLPSHRSRLMRRYIASQRRWLVVERLPAYAPELNPVEGLWGNLKGTELANFCVATIGEAATAADAGLSRIGEDARLCWAFLRHAGLSL